ncbi:hypothetical protein WJX82_002682 [Trebouxia sp. C0006]
MTTRVLIDQTHRHSVLQAFFLKEAANELQCNISLDSAPLALNHCSKAACAYPQPTDALKSPNMTGPEHHSFQAKATVLMLPLLSYNEGKPFSRRLVRMSSPVRLRPAKAIHLARVNCSSTSRHPRCAQPRLGPD